MARSAADHGATSMYPSVLSLKPGAYAQLTPFLKREFPQLVRRYKEPYARSANLNGEYKEGISRAVAGLRAGYELDIRHEKAPLARKYQQLALGI